MAGGPGESLGWETGTLLSSNWLLNNLTTWLAGPGRGCGVGRLLEQAKDAWPMPFACSPGTFCVLLLETP